MSILQGVISLACISYIHIVLSGIERPPQRTDDLYEEALVSFEDFEWDKRKRQLNLERHGIDIRGAVRIFEGLILQKRSDQKSEVRWLAFGTRDGQVISVIYTQRNKSCRIISARAARRKESAAYHARFA